MADRNHVAGALSAILVALAIAAPSTADAQSTSGKSPPNDWALGPLKDLLKAFENADGDKEPPFLSGPNYCKTPALDAMAGKLRAERDELFGAVEAANLTSDTQAWPTISRLDHDLLAYDRRPVCGVSAPVAPPVEDGPQRPADEPSLMDDDHEAHRRPRITLDAGVSILLEPGVNIVRVGGSASIAIVPRVDAAVQIDFGVTSATRDNGSTLRVTTSNPWSVIPKIGYTLPVADKLSLRGSGGYGAFRFDTRTTIFNGNVGTSFNTGNTVGAGFIGLDAMFRIDDANAIRLSVGQYFFDNGSDARSIGLSFQRLFTSGERLKGLSLTH